MSYYINPNAILDNSIKQSSLPVKVQEKVDLYHINKQKPVIVGRVISVNSEEGSRYYFNDRYLKVKGPRGIKTQPFIYVHSIPITRDGFIFTIPKKNTSLSTEVREILEKIGNSTSREYYLNDEEKLIIKQCITDFSIPERFSSETRSPYVKIVKGEVTINKPLNLTLEPAYFQNQGQYSNLSSFNFIKTIKFNYPVLIFRYSRNQATNRLRNKINPHTGSTFTEQRSLPWDRGKHYKYKYKYRKKLVTNNIQSVTNVMDTTCRAGFYFACPYFRHKNRLLIQNGRYFKIYRTKNTGCSFILLDVVAPEKFKYIII